VGTSRRAYWKLGDQRIVPTAITITDIGRPPQAMEVPEVGDRVGRYTVLGQLGAGAMGAVFLASDPELNRRVAIKVMVLRGAHDFRLLDEARALARLQHPNVVAIHDVGRWQGQVYMAMEHIAGVSLDSWLEAHRDWRERLGVFRQAALGLVAAHRAKIVHHDVKPANIMVDEDGRVRLVDFGLARSAEPDHAIGSVAGTPRYMSPEQRRGEVADARTDQFSLCVALYEALFDQCPFAGDTPQDREQAALVGRIVAPPAGPVPARISAAIVRGLALAPADRHATIEALLAELDEPARPARGKWIAGVALGAVVAGGIGAAAIVHRRGAPAGKWAEILASSHLPPTLDTPLPDDPLGVTVHRLSNGLTVYISPNHETPRVHALFRFRSGDRDAPGIAVLAMRMSRRGTETIGTVDFAKERPLLDRLDQLYAQHAKATDEPTRAKLDAEIDQLTTESSRYEIADEHTQVLLEMGAHRIDATTFRDQTWFEEDIPTNWLPMWAEVSADRWAHPVFRAFRPVVAEVLGYAKDASFYSGPLLDAVFPKLFAGNSLGFSNEEMRATVQSEPLAKVEAYYRSHFIPNDADLILSGDVDPVTAIPVLEKAFAIWEPKQLPPKAPLPTAEVVPETIELATPGNRSVSMLWRIPIELEADPALRVMLFMLGAARREAHASGLATLGTGSVAVIIEPTPNEPLADTERRLLAQVEQVRTGAFKDETLAAVKHDLRVAEQLSGLDDHQRVVTIAGWSWQLQRSSWRDLVAATNREQGVTRADVMRVAQAIVTRPRITVHAEAGKVETPVVTGPKVPELAFAVGHSQAAAALLARDRTPLQPKFSLAGVDYEERPITGGTLVAKHMAKSTIFVLQTRFEVGSAALPLVCAALGARMTTLQPTIRAHGLQPELVCNHRWISLILKGLDEDFDAATAVMHDVWTEPSDDEWRLAQQTFAEERTTYAGRTDWIPTSIEQYAVFGPSAPFLARFDIDLVKRATAAEAGQSLASLRNAPRWASYVGPRTADEVATKMPPAGGGTAPTQGFSATVASDRPRVIILDTKGLTHTTYVTALFPLTGMYDNLFQARLEMLETYWKSESMSGSLYSGFSMQTAYPYAMQEPGYAAVRIQGTTEDVVPRLQRALSLIFEQALDKDRFATAKAERFETLQTDWIKSTDVGWRTVSFRAHGFSTDPRIDFSQKSPNTVIDDLRAMTDELRKSPRVYVVWGNTEGLDRKGLAALGDITELTVQDLLDAHSKAAGAAPAANQKKPAPSKRRH
jgi:predicted Zn-dependent peptidase